MLSNYQRLIQGLEKSKLRVESFFSLWRLHQMINRPSISLIHPVIRPTSPSQLRFYTLNNSVCKHVLEFPHKFAWQGVLTLGPTVFHILAFDPAHKTRTRQEITQVNALQIAKDLISSLYSTVVSS